jgi:serine/threonine protein kinase
MEQNKIFFGKYRIVLDASAMPVELRRSTTGVTCHAQEIESGKDVALELVPAASLKPEAREQIAAEAMAGKQLSHVNIPTLYDFGFEEDDLVYVTEYLDGTTAEAWVTSHGPMPVHAVLNIARQVVSALGAATFHLIVHRSIHPGNLLIVPGQTADGEWPLVKVLNFGRVLPSAFTSGRTSVLDKSAPFASPEQVKNGIVDFRSEIYSLGCTLWSLLTGMSRFNAPREPVAVAQMAPAMKSFGGVPKKIRRLIAEMVSINPDERPLDPVMMTERLQDCLTYVRRRAAIARRFGISTTWQRRRIARASRLPIPMKPLAVAAMLLVLAAMAALLLTKSSRPDSLWKRFTNREPIGMPVGVPEASISPAFPPAGSSAGQGASRTDEVKAGSEMQLINRLEATDSTANNASAAAPAATAAPIVASANNQNSTMSSQEESPNIPANTQIEQSATAASDLPATASADQAAATPSQAESPSSPPNEQTEQSPTSAKDNVPAAETAAAATKPLESEHTEPSAPVATNNIPRAELVEPPTVTEAPNSSTNTHAEQSARVATNNVPRAELVEGPPLKHSPHSSTRTKRRRSAPLTTNKIPRAELVEPPPPAQGPGDLDADFAMASSSSAERQNAANTVGSKSHRNSREVTKSPNESNKRTATISNAKIRAEGDGAVVQLPGGAVHARFVGTTPDGKWLLALPSHKVLAVPPPPDFP